VVHIAASGWNPSCSRHTAATAFVGTHSTVACMSYAQCTIGPPGGGGPMQSSKQPAHTAYVQSYSNTCHLWFSWKAQHDQQQCSLSLEVASYR
jgi:hypothetical protein